MTSFSTISTINIIGLGSLKNQEIKLLEKLTKRLAHQLDTQAEQKAITAEKISGAIGIFTETVGETSLSDFNYFVNLCAGRDIEVEINKENSEGFFNLIGKTSLIDAIDLISQCKAAVTNDSGLMHIAAAVDTPLVAVYGPSTPKFTPPLIKNHIVLRKFDGFDKTRQGQEEGGYHES